MGNRTPKNMWPPGVSGNPNGRPKCDRIAMPKMNAQEFARVVLLYMDLPLKDIQEKFQDPNTPAKDLIILKILVEAIKKGDTTRLGFLLERTIGKVKEEIDITSHGMPIGVNFEDKDKIKEILQEIEKDI